MIYKPLCLSHQSKCHQVSQVWVVALYCASDLNATPHMCFFSALVLKLYDARVKELALSPLGGGRGFCARLPQSEFVFDSHYGVTLFGKGHLQD